MPDCSYFEYGGEETDWLGGRDKKLGEIMERLGHIQRQVYPEAFPALLLAVIGQQISGKAQASIWARFCGACAPISPRHVAGLELEAMRSCGISLRKAEYLRQIAGEFASGSLKDVNLAALEDGELASRLSALRGVGRWTVEMLLIFTFQRKNILSYGDLAIQRGMRMLYGHREISPALFSRYRKRYSPFGTIASFYLWEVSAGKIPELRDPARRENAPARDVKKQKAASSRKSG